MVGALLNDNRGLARVDKMTTDRIKKGWISNSGIIKSVVGLFTLARTDFADIELSGSARMCSVSALDGKSRFGGLR